MSKVQFAVNGKNVDSTELEMPLLWFLRDILQLTGAKYGCGIARCGACTVHVNGMSVRSCMIPLKDLQSKNVTTIEGLSSPTENKASGSLHAVQQAWVDCNVPQCGYCQCGQIMQAAALLKAKPQPTEAEIEISMSGNLCRCGTYPRIKKAIQLASSRMGGK
jgi:isoquinoline 1-oxidoreductase subunit alpha